MSLKTEATPDWRVRLSDVVIHGDKDARWLSQLAVMEDPWKLAWRCMPMGIELPVISQDSMALYYRSIMGEHTRTF